MSKSKGRRWIFNEETGHFEEGKARPKLLREDLRKLPSEYITEDHADGDKIHEIDPPHVAETIRDELVEVEAQAEEDSTPSALEALIAICDAPLEDRVVPLTQWRVDAVRLRTIFALIERASHRAARNQVVDLEVRHLRFPQNNVHAYSLNNGNPPPRKKLKPWERDIKLWVDPFNWPEALTEKLQNAGVEMPSLTMEQSQYRNYRLKLSEARMKDAGL